jgi:hypothetical protein
VDSINSVCCKRKRNACETVSSRFRIYLHRHFFLVQSTMHAAKMRRQREVL